jgi:hypothetical protein
MTALMTFTPAVSVTLTPKQAETLICLFRNEADRLSALKTPTHEPTGCDNLLALAQDVEQTLNKMFPERAAFVADHD